MTTTPTAISTWVIDPVHTNVEVAVRHMMTMFKGRFRRLEGTISIDEANPVNSSVTVSIDTTSFDVIGERFFNMMMGEDFFRAEQFPHITFRSTRVERIDDTHWTIVGDLTIRDVTREVALATEYLGQAKHPVSGKTIASFRAQTALDRRDYGITWNQLLETGVPYLGNEVQITIDMEAVRQE